MNKLKEYIIYIIYILFSFIFWKLATLTNNQLDNKNGGKSQNKNNVLTPAVIISLTCIFVCYFMFIAISANRLLK